MNNIKYSLSFITCQLLLQESITIASLYLEKNDWERVRDVVIDRNILQTRTLSTSKKNCRELISRLKTLSLTELNLLVNEPPLGQGYLLWIAMCRRYRFIAEFATEVLREHYLTLKILVNQDDFERFFNRKSDWHPELETVTEATRVKSRQILYKMMRETNLLTSDNTIQGAVFSPRLMQIISTPNCDAINYFPVFGPELTGVKL